MKTSTTKVLSAATLCCSVATGCVTTTGQQQATGAGLGALTGAGLAALAGGDTKAIVAGALAGGLVGWGAVKLHQYQSTQTRSAVADQQLYGLTEPVTGTTVKIRRGICEPGTVQKGQSVKVVTDYSVMAPQGGSTVAVSESWALKKDGSLLANIPAPQGGQMRPAGGYAAEAYIPIPANAAPGTYVVEHKVQSGTSYDVDESVFVVAG